MITLKKMHIPLLVTALLLAPGLKAQRWSYAGYNAEKGETYFVDLDQTPCQKPMEDAWVKVVMAKPSPLQQQNAAACPTTTLKGHAYVLLEEEFNPTAKRFLCVRRITYDAEDRLVRCENLDSGEWLAIEPHSKEAVVYQRLGKR